MMQRAEVAAADRVAFEIGVFMSAQDGSPLPPSVCTGGPIGPPVEITCSPGCSESAVVASPVWPSDPVAAGVAVAVAEPDPCSPPPQPPAGSSSTSIPTRSVDDLTDCTPYPLVDERTVWRLADPAVGSWANVYPDRIVAIGDGPGKGGLEPQRAPGAEAADVRRARVCGRCGPRPPSTVAVWSPGEPMIRSGRRSPSKWSTLTAVPNASNARREPGTPSRPCSKVIAPRGE